MDEKLTKKEIRKVILAERSTLDEETAALAAQVICRRIMDIDVYEEATDVCLYMPTRNEVDVLLLAEPAMEAGKGVWVPKVVEKTTGAGSEKQAGVMVFNRFTGLGEEDIITGAYDIRESRSEEILEPGEGTLIIMPGAVFTPWKDRIGYGGGFYDRFLEEHPQCRTIAVCYDLQVVDELPVEEHDRKPDYVVCETSVFK
ncbi:MAG: 5-formyltetrahydrofolate cyclo-ligase [Clostridia bacterium]|nr:5-formyltetrahydrofolate cyclo-ligase [Clostridia bacterium]